MSTIAIVDYGSGNLRSVAQALTHVAPRDHVLVTSNPDQIEKSDKIVFPGQGAAADCMTNLVKHELVESVNAAFKNKPFFGICMGLQVLFDHSTENGGVECLANVSGNVKAFERNPHLPECKIPHMGWNEVQQSFDHALWSDIENNSRFYFVHSYYVVPEDTAMIAGSCEYLGRFCCAIGHDNVFATQFHPEKSAADGLQLLRNFSQWNV